MIRHLTKLSVLLSLLSLSAYAIQEPTIAPQPTSFVAEQIYEQALPISFSYELFSLRVDSGALKHNLAFRFAVVKGNETLPMPSNMVNTTGDFVDCYRLLPSGDHFSTPALITIPYDIHRIPMGYTANDVYSYFFDEEHARWTQLTRHSLDTITHTITSYTTHFTDFANAVIKVPELPESKAFVPTAMTDLPDINPLQSIPMVATPQANNRGTAELTYPIELPKGRRGLQPNVDLHYSSAGGNGILGIGWSIQTPAITIDTRWGVPRYELGQETEAYLVNGEQILMHDRYGEPIELVNKNSQFEQRKSGDIRFYSRDKRNQDYIIRSGSHPSRYFWKVTDRSGTTYYYGYDPFTKQIDNNAILTDANGNIAEWSLTAIVDVYGNYVHYSYSKDYSNPNNKNSEKYLDSIQYTGNVNTSLLPAYSVRFVYREQRQDTIIDGRLGFLRQTAKLLCTIQVEHQDEIIASYVMDYDSCSARTLSKSRLHAITKYDAHAIQCRHIDIKSPEWIDYEKVTQSNRALKRIEEGLLEKDTINERRKLPGSQTTFNYCDAVELPNIFREQHDYSQDDLGNNINRSFGGGAAFAAGIGGNILETDNSIGGNFNINYGIGFTNAMLIDLNGDGLPDYVFQDQNQIKYKKQLPNGSFSSDTVVNNISHLVREHSLSYSLGFQASFGAQLSAQLSASPLAFSNTFTDIYFADVNNDRLPDLITPHGVMINHLDENANPTFELVTDDRILSSDKQCNIIVRNGAVDPRLECDLSYEFVEFIPWEKVYANDSETSTENQMHPENEDVDNNLSDKEDSVKELLEQYSPDEDKYTIKSERNTQYDEHIKISAPIPMTEDFAYSDMGKETIIHYPKLEEILSAYSGPDYKIESTVDGLKIYQLVQACSNKDSLPNVDVVRVWVADQQRTITLNSNIRLLNDGSDGRAQSRKFDGVKYAIQWCKSVQMLSDGRLSSNSVELLRDGTIVNKNDTLGHPYTTTFTVAKGDVLMFRLSARDNRTFDDAEWTIEITDNTNNLSFKSDDDFYCWPMGDYIATQPGIVNMTIATQNNQHQPVSLSLYKNDSAQASCNLQYGHDTISRLFYVDATDNVHDTIRIKITYPGQEPKWSQVLVTPKLSITYTAGELAGRTIDYQLGSTIEGVSHIFSAAEDSARYKTYSDLFGVLHKNWGQFAYKNQSDYDQIILLEDLSNYVNDMAPKLLDSLSNNTLIQNMESYKDSVAASKDNIYSDTTIPGENAVSMPNFMDEYNPYSDNRRWITMQADAETQRWIVFGNLGALGARLQSTSLQPIAGSDTTSVEFVFYDSSIPVSIDGSDVKTVRKISFAYSPNVSVGGEIGKLLNANAHFSGGFNMVTSDFMDMNGDGFPDFIGRNSVQYTNPWGGIGKLVANQWKSYFSSNVSAGAGLSGSKSVVKKQAVSSERSNKTFNVGLATSEDYSYSKVNTTYLDVNGDGLPDMLQQGIGTGGNTVRYNLGYDFSDEYAMPDKTEINTTHNVVGVLSDSHGVSPIFSNEQRSISGGASFSQFNNTNTFRLIDIDGDGYLDKVNFYGAVIGATPQLKVSRNLFNQCWEGRTDLISNLSPSSITTSLGSTASFTVGIPILNVIKVVANPQFEPYSEARTQSKMELMDMNGDGFVDLIDENTIYYNANGMQPTNLLTSVTNPTGQVINLSYTQSEPTIEHAGRNWLLSSAYDSLPQGYGVDERASMGKEFTYSDAYYDTYEKTDYGYHTVKTQERNNNHAIYRTLVQDYANTDFINHGDLLQDSLSDGQHPYVVNKYNASFGYADNPEKFNVCDDKNMVRFSEEYHTYYYEGLPNAQIETAYTLGYDQYHNLIRRMDYGDVTIPYDDIEQLITYQNASGNNHNLISLPIREEVTSCGNLLRFSEMDYSSVGSPVSIRLFDRTTASETTLQYDVYGNVIQSLSPENEHHDRVTHHYAYDPTTESYPVFVCNQFGEIQLTQYDTRFGLPLMVIDPAGHAIQYRYDPMGRLTDVIAPQEDNVNMPTVHYDYHLPFHDLRPNIYSSINPDYSFPHISKVMFSGPQLSGAEVTLYDARGAELQKKVWQNVGGVDKWVVQSFTQMDKFGRNVDATTPFYSTLPVADYDTNWQGTSASMTHMVYDIMDRQRALIHPDGNSQTSDFGFGQDYNGTIRFRQKITNENNDSSILLLSPQKWTIQQINPLSQDTRFCYNAIGELISVTDADGYSTRYDYDMLGRMIGRIHPDAGVTQWEYDAMGNLVRMKTEALRRANQDVKYNYLYNRLVEVEYPIHTDLNTTYKYYSDGRLAQRYDACGTEEFQYDELGNVEQSNRWIHIPSDEKAYRFRHHYSYDSFGRIRSIIYPDNDSVTYYYHETGQLDSVNHTYQGQTFSLIKGYVYDDAGRKTKMVYGNDVVSTFQYSQTRNWLEYTNTYSSNIGITLQDLYYQYDPIGNITDIMQVAGEACGLGGKYRNRYNYDALNRLINSTGEETFGYSFNITMSPTGRIGNKFLDASGIGTSAQIHGYDKVYLTHQPRVVFDSIRGAQSLFWDRNGNLAQVVDCNSGTAQLNFWDEENRLRLAVNARSAGYYGYDANGERVYKLRGNTQYDDLNAADPRFGIVFDDLTVYPSPYIVMSGKQYTKHFYVGSEKIATLIGDGGLSFVEGGLEQEHQDRIKYGFVQSFQPEQFSFDYTDNVDIQDSIIEDVQYQCGYIEQPDISLISLSPMFESMVYGWVKEESNNNDVFFTHSDHLGSACWITNKKGDPIQYIHYAPYGELLANQKWYGYDERFKFTGKERDEESGYDFFGARYYDHRKGFWNSVDPLADKYPYVTPYLYCGGNPIKFIDPDGREKHNHFSLIKSFPSYQGFENLPDIEDYILIGAHGLSFDGKANGMSMAKEIGDSEKEYYGVNAVVDFIKKEVLANSNVVKRNKTSGEQTVVILNACNTGAGENSLARQMSEKLNDVVIVAPDSPTQNVQDPESAIFYQYGPRQNPSVIYKNGKLARDKNGIPIYKWGKVNNWKVFLNGNMIGIISGNQRLSHENLDSIIKATEQTTQN